MAELSLGTSLSHYRIISKIGAGGMGEVYRAQDNELGRPVALVAWSFNFDLNGA
ncbi:MAG: hypothetical protein ND866_04520 [Pyrinomonadaceae bacterium]|nr:hypothetical protein [Pyrinomonadaceae bacterium]